MDQDTQGLFQACKNVSTIENLSIQLHNILRIGDRVYKYLNRCMWSITFLFPVLHPSLCTMWLSVSSPRAGYTCPTFTVIELDHVTCFSQWEFYCILFYFFSLFLHLPNIYFLYCCSSTGVSISPLSLPPTPSIHTSQPQFYLPLALSMCPLYMFLDNPSPFRWKEKCSKTRSYGLWFFSACPLLHFCYHHRWTYPC